jgi:hypothetical protein
MSEMPNYSFAVDSFVIHNTRSFTRTPTTYQRASLWPVNRH